MLMTFINSLDPDQARQNVRPDLDTNCLTLWCHSWKNFWKNRFLKKSADENNTWKISQEVLEVLPAGAVSEAENWIKSLSSFNGTCLLIERAQQIAKTLYSFWPSCYGHTSSTVLHGLFTQYELLVSTQSSGVIIYPRISCTRRLQLPRDDCTFRVQRFSSVKFTAGGILCWAAPWARYFIHCL